jgi:hypothetical protein
MFVRKTYRILMCFVVVSCLAKQASAELLTITSMPVQSTGDLPHTNFHSSDFVNDDGSTDATGGEVLGWANLNPNVDSTYDPVSGALDLYLRIFGSHLSAEANTSPIGLAHGIGSGLFGSLFTADPLTPGSGTGDVNGTIAWDFDFFVYLEFFDDTPNLRPTVTMQFVDFNYVTTEDGFVANTWDGTNLTLWGADGTYPEGSMDGKFDSSTTTIGFDFVGVVGPTTTMVPEPSSIMLLLMGTTCFGGVGFWKRRRRGVPEQG